MEAELLNRQESPARRLLKQAGFPEIQTLEQIEWDAHQGIARPKILELARRVGHFPAAGINNLDSSSPAI